MKALHDNSWLLWETPVPEGATAEPGTGLCSGARSVQEVQGRKHSVVCAGDKPPPEHMRMGCDKICSAFVFQQVLKCLWGKNQTALTAISVTFPPINTPNPDKNSPALANLSNPPRIFIAMIIFNQKQSKDLEVQTKLPLAASETRTKQSQGFLSRALLTSYPCLWSLGLAAGQGCPQSFLQ